MMCADERVTGNIHHQLSVPSSPATDSRSSSEATTSESVQQVSESVTQDTEQGTSYCDNHDQLIVINS